MDCTQITYEDAIDILSEVQVFTEAGEYALHLATESLAAKSKAEEYRTPKKPIYGNMGGCKCPTCGENICSADADHFCPYCGQCLTWPEDI